MLAIFAMNFDQFRDHKDHQDHFMWRLELYRQRLIEHGGTKRSVGLTPTRESALAKFNEKVQVSGCTLNDLHVLEKPKKSEGIGMKIGIKDILGNKTWKSILNNVS